MPKTKQWFVRHGEDDVAIYYVPKPRRGKPFLMVNGMTVPVEKSSVTPFVGIDQPFWLGERECHLVVRGNKPELSVDGRFVENGRMYEPLQKLPWWTFVFILACMGVPVVSMGGVIPSMLAVVGVLGCVGAIQHRTLSKVGRFCLCFLITAATWGSFLLLCMVLVNLINTVSWLARFV